jgi:hypothetical protein
MALGRDDDEIDFMLEDAGVEVVLGTERVFGVFEAVDDLVLVGAGASFQKRLTTLVVKRGALSGLVHEATLVADGDTYQVRDIARRPGSTKLLNVTLAPAET